MYNGIWETLPINVKNSLIKKLCSNFAAGATGAAGHGSPASTPRCPSTSTGSAAKSEETHQVDETEAIDSNKNFLKQFNPTLHHVYAHCSS